MDPTWAPTEREAHQSPKESNARSAMAPRLPSKAGGVGVGVAIMGPRLVLRFQHFCYFGLLSFIFSFSVVTVDNCNHYCGE